MTTPSAEIVTATQRRSDVDQHPTIQRTVAVPNWASLSFLFGLLVYFATCIWWASGISSSQLNTEKALAKQETATDAKLNEIRLEVKGVAAAVGSQSLELAKLQGQADAIKATAARR